MLPILIFIEQQGGCSHSSCGWRFTHMSFSSYSEASTSWSLWVCVSWGTSEHPPLSTLGAHAPQGSQSKWLRTSLGCSSGVWGQPWLPWEWDSLPDSDAEASLRDHPKWRKLLWEVKQSAVKGCARVCVSQWMCVCVCLSECACVCVCAWESPLHCC